MVDTIVESNSWKAFVESIHGRPYSFPDEQIDMSMKDLKAGQEGRAGRQRYLQFQMRYLDCKTKINTRRLTYRLPAFIYFCLSFCLLPS